MKDYDELIGEIVKHWEEQNTSRHDYLKTAISRFIIPQLYNCIRKLHLNEGFCVGRDKFLGRFANIYTLLIHVWWGTLWTLKWVLTFRSHGLKNVVIIASGSHRKLSKSYFLHVSEYCHDEGLFLISLNVICEGKYLFTPNVFYYPRFIYFNSIRKESRGLVLLYDKIVNDLRNTVNQYLNLNCRFKLKRNFRRLCNDATFYLKLLEKTKHDNVKLLIQDYDYTYNKYMYCELTKINKIKTLVLDHSIRIYNHLFTKVHSDYAFVWGQHEMNRLQKASCSNKSIIMEMGRPFSPSASHKLKIKKKKYWLYLLSSYDQPAFQTISRSLQGAKKNVDQICDCMSKDREMLIRPHPDDRKKLFGDFGHQLYLGKLEKVLPYTELIFTEDTSMMIDLLLYNFPLVYVCGSNNRDYFDIERWGIVKILRSDSNLNNLIEESLNFQIDSDLRKICYEYFYGKSDYFENNFKRELKSILSVS